MCIRDRGGVELQIADYKLLVAGKIGQVLRWVVVLALPPFLVLSNIYLLMNTAYVRYEYGRADFPPAERFSDAERYRVAQTCITYLRTGAGIELLADLEGEGGPLFNQRELRHMRDVKVVTRWAFAVHKALGVLLMAAAVFLLWRRETWSLLGRAMLGGAALTVALFVVLGLFIVLDFNNFFTLFHRVFFEGDTWLFAPSDTLIQLFPLPFWFDAALILSGATLGEAALIGGLGWWWMRRLRGSGR